MHIYHYLDMNNSLHAWILLNKWLLYKFVECTSIISSNNNNDDNNNITQKKPRTKGTQMSK